MKNCILWRQKYNSSSNEKKKNITNVHTMMLYMKSTRIARVYNCRQLLRKGNKNLL